MPSTFPGAIDNIPQFTNIVLTDVPLITQFQAAVEAGNFQQAATIFTQIPNANNKLVGAARLNQLIDALIAVEQFYGTDIQPYVAAKQAEWQAIIDQFSYIAPFSSTTLYRKNNIVSYILSTGINFLYICTVDNPPVGTLPTNTAYWRQLTVQGKTGASGGNFSFKYGWDNTTTYYMNDVVTYNNNWWAATTENVNVAPVTGSSVWQNVLAAEQFLYPISETPPITQNVGELWFKVIP